MQQKPGKRKTFYNNSLDKLYELSPFSSFSFLKDHLLPNIQHKKIKPFPIISGSCTSLLSKQLDGIDSPTSTNNSASTKIKSNLYIVFNLQQLTEYAGFYKLKWCSLIPHMRQVHIWQANKHVTTDILQKKQEPFQFHLSNI